MDRNLFIKKKNRPKSPDRLSASCRPSSSSSSRSLTSERRRRKSEIELLFPDGVGLLSKMMMNESNSRLKDTSTSNSSCASSVVDPNELLNTTGSNEKRRVIQVALRCRPIPPPPPISQGHKKTMMHLKLQDPRMHKIYLHLQQQQQKYGKVMLHRTRRDSMDSKMLSRRSSVFTSEGEEMLMDDDLDEYEEDYRSRGGDEEEAHDDEETGGDEEVLGRGSAKPRRRFGVLLFDEFQRQKVFVQAHKLGGQRAFNFDMVFPPQKTQEEVYEETGISEMLQDLMDHVEKNVSNRQSRHLTIFCYGQTGTGKTFTMGLLEDKSLGDLEEKKKGIIPRALSQIIQLAGSSLKLSMSFCQIYLENVQDLLVSSTEFWKKSDLQVRQKKNEEFYVEGLNEYEISCYEEASLLLDLAMQNRVLAATKRNKTSSRSHTILTMNIYNELSNEETISTVSFVDLAGSERVDNGHAVGITSRKMQKQSQLRIQEAKYINRSLSALGSVIGALSRPSSIGSSSVTSSQHIRFRDSKLTKLLKKRLLGGKDTKCQVLLIATVDAQLENLTETLSTLKFATSCKHVRTIDQIPTPATISQQMNLEQQQLLLLEGKNHELFKHIFEEMKVMYEEREQMLHQTYQEKIKILEKEVKHLTCNAEGTQGMGSQQQQQQQEEIENRKMDRVLSVSSYLALCSLYDQIKLFSKEEKVDVQEQHPHPSILGSSSQAFESEKKAIHYVSELYNTISQAFKKRPLFDHQPSLTYTTAEAEGAQEEIEKNVVDTTEQEQYIVEEVEQLVEAEPSEEKQEEEEEEFPDEIESLSSSEESTDAHFSDEGEKKTQYEYENNQEFIKTEQEVDESIVEEGNALEAQEVVEGQEASVEHVDESCTAYDGLMSDDAAKTEAEVNTDGEEMTRKQKLAMEIEENFKNDLEFKEIYRNISQKIEKQEEDAFSVSSDEDDEDQEPYNQLDLYLQVKAELHKMDHELGIDGDEEII